MKDKKTRVLLNLPETEANKDHRENTKYFYQGMKEKKQEYFLICQKQRPIKTTRKHQILIPRNEGEKTEYFFQEGRTYICN
jgi:hypothetical protein